VNAFDFARFRQLAGQHLRREEPQPGDLIARPRSDCDLDVNHPATMGLQLHDEVSLKPAAVLVPVINRPGGATVLLTMRAAALRDHSAQIAFPGGKIDAGDASPVETALREAEEEIGLSRAHVTPLGFLDAYLTGTGYRIVPVVAAVEPAFELSINRGEVDEAFETPLGFLMNPANHEWHGRIWKGSYRSYYAMTYADRYIWGATAGILRNLHDRLLGAPHTP
jgi:8-oxo-dGTP pyrophosphatase MutT (NUDIX family)